MTDNVMRYFVKFLFDGRNGPLVYLVDKETADRVRRNLTGTPNAFCCFSTLDGRDVAVNLTCLDLVHFLWESAMPELHTAEHRPTCVYFVGRDEPFCCDPEDAEEAFNVFFLLELDGAELDRFLELTDEDGEVLVFDARKVQVVEMSSALVAEGAAKFDEDSGRGPAPSGDR
jgi:hypothetical protein